MGARAAFAMIVVAFNLAPAVAHATCVNTGHVSMVVAVGTPPVSSFYVISTAPMHPPSLYTTYDVSFVNAVRAAQAKDMIVEVAGSAASCPAAAAGVVHGGAVQRIIKKYQPLP